MAADDIILRIGADGSSIEKEIENILKTSKTKAEAIEKAIAQGLGGEFETIVEFKATATGFEKVERETNSVTRLLERFYDKQEKLEAAAAAKKKKAADDEKKAINDLYDKWEASEKKKRDLQAKAARQKKKDDDAEAERNKRNAARAIADADRQYEAYLRGLLKRQSEERKAEQQRQKNARQAIADANKAANAEAAKAEKIRKENEKTAQELKKQAAIRSGSLNDLNRRIKKEQELLNNLKRGTAEYEKQQKVVNDLSRARRIEISGLTGGQLDAQDAQKGLGQIVDNFNRISFAASALLGIFGTLSNALSGFVRAQSELQSFALSFKAIGAGSAGATIALQESQRIALSLGADINAVRDGFQRLSPVILQSGGSIEQVGAVVESLASRFAVFGRSAAESQRIMNAVVQAFGKGKLMAEELNQQISEADPAFRVDLARAIGVTTAELAEMVKNGEITTELMLKYIPLMSKASIVTGKLGLTAGEAAEALSKGQATINQFQTQLANISKLNIENIGKQFEPLFFAVAKVNAAVTDFITKLTQSGTFDALAATINATAVAFGNIAAGLLEFGGILLAIIEPVASIIASLLKLPPVAAIVGTALTAYIGAVIVSITQKIGLWVASSNAFLGVLGSITSASSGFASAFSGIGEKIRNFVGINRQAVEQVRVSVISTEQAGGAMVKYSNAVGGATGAIVKYDAAMAAKNAKEAAAKAATKQKNAEMLKEIGMTLAVAAAIYGVTAAIDAYKKSQGDSAAISARLTKEFANIDQQLQDLTNSLSEGADKIDLFSQRLEELASQGDNRNFFQKLGAIFSQENQTNANALASEINAISKAYQGLLKPGLDAAKAIKEYSGAQKASAEETLQAQAIIDAYLKKLRALQAEAVKARNEALAKAQADGFVSEQEKEMLEAINNTVKGLNAEIEAFEKAAQAKGLNTKATQENKTAEEQLEEQIDKVTKKIIASLEAQKQAIQKAGEARVEALEEQKRLITETAQAEISALEKNLKRVQDINKAKLDALKKEKQATIDSYNILIEKVNAAKAAEQARHDAAISQLDKRKAKMEAYYDAELARIDKAIAKVNSQYDAQIAGLQALGPAEQALKRLELKKLRDQARNAETAEERLRAQAQLERIAREEQIAIIREQQAKKIAALEKQKAEEEKKRAEEAAALEKERAAELEAHKNREKQFEQEIAGLNAGRKNYERKINNIIAKEKERAQKQEKALEEEIAQKKEALAEKEKEIERIIREEKKRTAALVEDLQKRIDELKRQEAERNDEILIGEQKINEAIRERIRLMEKLNSMKGGSTDGDRFAGGPVTGGSTYTVNELGQEAFLSRSGQLSLINAPAFGKWRAPGAGTVIPAHITAGLNIPRGGVPVNTKASQNASRTSGTGMTAAMLRTLSGGSAGRVTNNVTIQSQSPVTDASRMLVEMSKLKIRRR